jgi:H/ACA ribonucleoprotein complex subunit 4
MNIQKIKADKTISELLEFGILNIDKPSGPTSFNISDFIRKKLGLRKTSHFGTLDPKVTGVLPIALNRACKLTGYFIRHNKEYIGIMRFHKDIEITKVQEIINKKFLGKIKQIPPIKSRVARKEREREIKKFELLEQDKRDILFRTEVEGGTYIRKLIDDLGKEIEIKAHMLELRRTRAGIFSEENSINLYDFEKALEENRLKEIITPAEKEIKKIFPALEIKKNNLKKILTGKPITKEDLVKIEKFKRETITSIFCGNQFVGIYKIIDDKNIFAKPEFVMQPINN